MRACLASLLEMPITRVPDFTAMREPEDSELPVWYIEQQAFCRSQGYAFFETQLDLKTLFPFPWPVYCIFIGVHAKSPPEQPVRHAIVGMIDGTKLVPIYDPLQTGPDPADAFMQKKVTAIAFLVPVDPAKLCLRPEGLKLLPPPAPTNGRRFVP